MRLRKDGQGSLAFNHLSGLADVNLLGLLHYPIPHISTFGSLLGWLIGWLVGWLNIETVRWLGGWLVG